MSFHTGFKHLLVLIIFLLDLFRYTVIICSLFSDSQFGLYLCANWRLKEWMDILACPDCSESTSSFLSSSEKAIDCLFKVDHFDHAMKAAYPVGFFF